MIYISLFNGRKDPAENLDDWGERGPVLGPFSYVHMTYATDIKFDDGSDCGGRLLWVGPNADLVYYNGVYYGDVSVCSAEELAPELEQRIEKYDEAKATPSDSKNEHKDVGTEEAQAMTEYMSVGPVPSCEDCVQLGTPDYYEKAMKECRAFRGQLLRVFGNPPLQARFVIRGFSHDLGRYYEVCVAYNSNNEKESDFAYKVESETPEEWDKKAKKVLGITA